MDSDMKAVFAWWVQMLTGENEGHAAKGQSLCAFRFRVPICWFIYIQLTHYDALDESNLAAARAGGMSFKGRRCGMFQLVYELYIYIYLNQTVVVIDYQVFV